jgi:hypothetical protein
MMSDKRQFVVGARKQPSPTDDKLKFVGHLLTAAPLGLGYLRNDLTKLAKAMFLV